MNRLQLFSRNGKEILLIDLSSCTVQDALLVIQQAAPLIRTRKPKSLRTLTDVTNSHYNQEWARAIKDFAKANDPFVCASAVVGVTQLGQVLIASIRIFTGRTIRTFDDRESAIQWLVTQ